MPKLVPPWEEVLFSWLHVSDIHVGHGESAHGWDQKLVLDTLRRDVEQLLAGGRVPSPDVVLVTGDVAFSGATKAIDEYTRAAQWLSSLATVAGLETSKVWVVPGNHDVERSADARDKNVRRLVRGLRSGEDSFDASLADPGDVDLLTQRMANYLDFARGFGPPRSEVELAATPFYWRQVLSVKEGLDVCFVGLNTALLAADDEDQGKLRLGSAQLAHALLDRGPGPVVMIILSHHPLAGGWLADEKNVATWVRNHAHVHLSGHVHAADAEQVVSGGGASFLRVTAGAAHGDADQVVPASHGYNFGALVRSRAGEVGLAIWPRRWSPKNGDFRRDGENVKDGMEYSVHSIARIRLARPTQQDPQRLEQEGAPKRRQVKIADMKIVGFFTPSLAQNESTVDLPWPGGAGRIEARLDVGGFEAAVAPENAPRGMIVGTHGATDLILFDERTESTVVQTIDFSMPRGFLKFRSFCEVPGALGELRAQIFRR